MMTNVGRWEVPLNRMKSPFGTGKIVPFKRNPDKRNFEKVLLIRKRFKILIGTKKDQNGTGTKVPLNKKFLLFGVPLIRTLLYIVFIFSHVK